MGMEWIADIQTPADDCLVTGGDGGYEFLKQYDSKAPAKCELIQQSSKDGVIDTHLMEDVSTLLSNFWLLITFYAD